MRRTYIISDRLYRLSHSIKRNRGAVTIYALMTLLFLVIGVAIGVTIGDKESYALGNGAPVFRFLRGDSGAVVFFALTALFSLVYGAFAASLFFFKVTSFLSIASCVYAAYSLGVYTCVLIGIYSASALPMLFVLFIPTCIVEIVIFCMLSYRCIAFASINVRCSPSPVDIKCYYKECLPYAAALVMSALVKAFTLALFGSALVGII